MYSDLSRYLARRTSQKSSTLARCSEGRAEYSAQSRSPKRTPRPAVPAVRTKSRLFIESLLLDRPGRSQLCRAPAHSQHAAERSVPRARIGGRGNEIDRERFLVVSHLACSHRHATKVLRLVVVRPPLRGRAVHDQLPIGAAMKHEERVVAARERETAKSEIEIGVERGGDIGAKAPDGVVG